MSPKSLAHVLPLLNMPGVQSYVEPFGTSAAVMLHRHPTDLETYNDVRDDVVVFFRSLRNEMKRTLAKIAKTEFSALSLKQAWKLGKVPELEQARRFYARSCMVVPPDKAGTWNSDTEVMRAVERLRHVQIECISPFKCIRDFDTEKTLFYVRPQRTGQVRERMLAQILNSLVGRVALHAPRSELTDALYSEADGWMAHERTPSDCLWTNYEPVSTRTLFNRR